LSSLVLKNNSTFMVRMKNESGDRSCPIWLLVNPKYPNDVYDIWTPILYEIQDKVYRKLHARIDRGNIFIMNAGSDIGRAPSTLNCRTAEVAEEIVKLRESVLEHQPKLLITFGSITNEFVRRIFDTRTENGPKYWNTTNLGDEFERSITNFDITRTNWIPIIRRATKSGKIDWDDSENYYHYVATKITDRIIENKDSLKIWI